MANWAIVIGIDRYWSEGAHLRGAVRDALSVHEWLLDPAGGNVPATNLQLVLSPGPNSPAVGPELGAIDGTKSNIVIAITNLLVLSGGKGERLYFFFAGHGLTSRISNRDESAVLATNFTNINTDQSLALRSVWEFLRDDPVRRPVPLRRRLPERASLGRRGRVRARPLDAPAKPRPGHAARAAVHPLRHFAQAEGGRGARQTRRRARRLHRGATRWAARRRAGQGVVVGPAMLRGALGAARELREEPRRA